MTVIAVIVLAIGWLVLPGATCAAALLGSAPLGPAVFAVLAAVATIIALGALPGPRRVMGFTLPAPAWAGPIALAIMSLNAVAQVAALVVAVGGAS